MSHNDFKSGDEVILTGWRVGEIYFGGYSEYAKVNGDFLVKKPKNLSLKESMILGTAGFTALQCSFTTKTTREEIKFKIPIDETVSITWVTSDKRVVNRKNHQNSARVALPLKFT